MALHSKRDSRGWGRGMERIIRLLVCVGFVATCSTAIGQLVPDTPVTRAQWIAHLQTTAPLFLCRRTSELRACFSLSSQVCEEDIASATRVCISQVEGDLSDEIQVLQGKTLGARVSECVTSAFAALHHGTRNDTAACSAFIKPASTSQVEQELAEMPGTSRSEVEPTTNSPVERASTRVVQSSEMSAVVAPSEGKNVVTSRAAPAATTGDVLYTLVSPKDLGNFWKMNRPAKEEPDYPMALKGARTFCVATGFGIDASGVPNSISPLHTTAMPGATEKKLHLAVERYIATLRFSPTTQGPTGVPVFTYIVLGRYGYRHGSTDEEKGGLGSRIVTECARVAEHKLTALRARSR